MDFNNPNALLEFLLYSNVSYGEYVELCDKLSTKINPLHKTIGGMQFNNVLQCFLECYKIKNNFSKSIWLLSKYAEEKDIKQNAYPIFFKKRCSNNEYITYEYYNLDQLNFEYNEPTIDIKKPVQIEQANTLKQQLINCLFQAKTRDAEIFKLRFGLTYEKCLTLENIGLLFGITRERVRQIIVKVERRIRNNLKYNPDFKDLYLQLNVIVNIFNDSSENNIIDKEIVKDVLKKYFNDDNIIYLDLINNIMWTCFEIKEPPKLKITKNDITNLKLRKAILACIREFSTSFGKSGIAKILKGNSLKNGVNYNKAQNSQYYGSLKQLSLSFIENEIDKMINENLIKVKKIGQYARPVLEFLPESEEILLKTNINENDDDNIIKILKLVKDGKNVFITGHAGTGKSYILNKLKEKIPHLVLTSTTGIAAVNIKGQTIHSWSGIGICKQSVAYTVDKINKKDEIKKRIQNCSILAIDEISMLNIETLDYLNAILQAVRCDDRVFGGIQVIFIGDFYQLPPVEDITEIEDTRYCFESTTWNELDLHTIMLTKNYRQNEPDLINALSNMRVNNLTQKDIALFKSREFQGENIDKETLHIFATNFEADNYNKVQYEKINSLEYNLVAFDGIYKGEKLIDTPTNSTDEAIFKRIDVVCMAQKHLSLKIGARVMLLKNLDFKKNLINGSCGIVEKINDDFIGVRFDNGITANIEKQDFEFYNNNILIAIRRQFPLKLAYAITIHKSQGMSLDKLVVDCSKIFEKGQAYVALSRIKTLNGLYLYNFNPAKVMVDEKVVEFYKNLKIDNDLIDISEEKAIKNEDVILKELKIKHNTNPIIETFLEQIRNIVIDCNNWISIGEIAKIMGVEQRKPLVENDNLTTIAHLINRFLKKEGFKTQRINFQNKTYIIVVSASNIDVEIPEKYFKEP